MQNIKNVCSHIKSHSNDAFKFLIELYDEEFKKIKQTRNRLFKTTARRVPESASI